MKLDMDLIFDILVIAMGILLIAECFMMKAKQVVPSLFIPANDMAYCIDKSGLISYIFPIGLIFGIISIGYGAFALYVDRVNDLSIYAKWIGLIVFIGAWIAFSMTLKRAREKFFNKVGR